MKFLIDECLSTQLVGIARSKGCTQIFGRRMTDHRELDSGGLGDLQIGHVRLPLPNVL